MKNLLCILVVCTGYLFAYSQVQEKIQYSPGGLLDNVYDHYGNHYTLDDIKINKEPIALQNQNKVIFETCNSGIFRLHFTAGSGFLDNESPDAATRRAVVCQVFNDLSNFINSPLHNTGNTQKVEIWVRDINAVLNPINSASTSQLGGMASSFYVLPTTPTAITVKGGVIDNEIWKTVHTGIDSYTNVTPPIITTGGSNDITTDVFYHGYIAINFQNTSINWNLNTGIACPLGMNDLYSTVLHEATHALGFASLLTFNGSSRFGNQEWYYNRYDTFLRVSGTPILEAQNECNPMYNTYPYAIEGQSYLHPGCEQMPPVNSTWSGITNCTSAIRYVGTNNVPVYTPSCFEPSSSLSHFEDSCIATPNQNNINNYFVMTDASPSGSTKRFLRTEERNTLCDIGYSVNNQFGGTAFQNNINYGGSICNGIQVAGVNDGIFNSSYSFIGLATNVSPIIIPINGNTTNNNGDLIQGILKNDINGITNSVDDIRIECLQDIYDTTARFNNNLTTFSSLDNSVSFITYTTNVSGIHLLRYIPIVNGIRGNITYVYVYVDNTNCVNTTCGFVNNGDFENSSGCFMFNIPSVKNGKLGCWYQLNGSVDLYRPNECTFVLINPLPQNGQAYLGVANSNDMSESFQQRLSNPLTGGNTYRLRFMARRKISPNNLVNCGLGISAYTGNILVSTGPLLQNFGTQYSNSNPIVILPNMVIQNHESWTQYEHIFTMPVGANHQNIAIYNLLPNGMSNGNHESYLFIDDISIELISAPVNFNIPNETLCLINSNLPNLFSFITGISINGTFSSSLNNGPFTLITNNTFTPTTAGTYTINYTYTNNLGCPITISDTINVTNCTNPITPTFNAIAPLCQGSTPPALSSSSTNTPAITGTWNPSTISTATVGAFNYTFTPNAGQNASNTSIIITVSAPATPATITGNANLCVGATSQLNTSSTGGTWSSLNTTVASVSASGVVTGLMAGTASIQYTIPANAGCTPVISTYTVSVSNCSNNCLNNITLSNLETFTSHIYKSSSWIETNNNYTVSANKTITMEAQTYIVSKPNTAFLAGSNCWLRIKNCGDKILQNSEGVFRAVICYSENNQSTSNLNYPNTSILNHYTIDGSPVNQTDVYFNYNSLPNGITINPDGTINIAGGVNDGTYSFTVNVCLVGTSTCIPINVYIHINPLLNLHEDNVVYDVKRNYCNGNNNVILNDVHCNGIPVSANEVTLTMLSNTGSNYFTVNANGNISIVNGVTSIPQGTYTINYQLCLNSNPTICSTANANIQVIEFCNNNKENGFAQDNSNISIYPNPSKSLFNINFGTILTEETTLKVYNSLGQVLISKNLNNIKEFVVDLSNYPSGFYILQIDNKFLYSTQKLIKE